LPRATFERGRISGTKKTAAQETDKDHEATREMRHGTAG
jgi:hypothetical protein